MKLHWNQKSELSNYKKSVSGEKSFSPNIHVFFSKINCDRRFRRINPMNLQSVSTSHLSKCIDYFPPDLFNSTHITIHTIPNKVKHTLNKMAEIVLLAMVDNSDYLKFNLRSFKRIKATCNFSEIKNILVIFGN